MFSFLTADKAATADAPAAVVNAFSAESQQKFAKQERPAEPVSRKRSAEEKAAAEASEKKRKPRKPKKEPPSAEELEARALKAANAAPDLEVFVGNLPLTTKPKELEKLFKEYGDVVSVRLRSLPVAGTAVDVNGDMNLMKKVCAYRGKLSDAKDSVNAYGTCLFLCINYALLIIS
jgi:nucleolar protein 12